MLPLLFVLAAQLQPGNGSPEFRQPQLAVGQDQVVLTFGSGSAIYFASSTDGGRKFSSPVKVADPGTLALGHHRGPRVNLLPGVIVISAVVEGGKLALWRSIDRGKTWTRTGSVTDVIGAAREGFHAMASDQQGNLFAAWLDSRASETRLYGALSKDGGVTWSPNIQLYSSPDGTVCQCCAPSVAMDENGAIWVMFRNVLDGDRDLYLLHSTDGIAFGPAQRLGLGSWPLDACPMDGGGLVTDQGHVISAWRREDDLFLTEPGHPEYRMGQGKDVAVTVSPKGTYVMWSGVKGLRLWKTGVETSSAIGREGSYPVLVTLPDGVVLGAWEYHGAIEVERIP
jgi:hypothetical protein